MANTQVGTIRFFLRLIFFFHLLTTFTIVPFNCADMFSNCLMDGMSGYLSRLFILGITLRKSHPRPKLTGDPRQFEAVHMGHHRGQVGSIRNTLA